MDEMVVNFRSKGVWGITHQNWREASFFMQKVTSFLKVFASSVSSYGVFDSSFPVAVGEGLGEKEKEER